MARRGQEVPAARVVGVADRAVTVAVVDGVLAPDVALADVEALFFGQPGQVLGGEKPRQDAPRPVAAAHERRDHPQRVVQVAVDLGPGVVHGREIPARDERDLVPVLVVEALDQPPDLPVVRPGVLEREPAQRPGHAAAGESRRERRAKVAHGLGRMDGRLVDALVPVAADLDLVDPDDRVKGQKPVFEEARQSRIFGRGGGNQGWLAAKAAGREGRGRGSSGHGQERASVEGHGRSHCRPSPSRTNSDSQAGLCPRSGVAQKDAERTKTSR